MSSMTQSADEAPGPASAPDHSGPQTIRDRALAARLGVVVLAYGPDKYVTVVDGLLRAGLGSEQITVVQNPRTADEARFSSEAEVLQMPRNDGYGAAMNAAIRARRRRGDALVLLLTHDTILPEAGLAALIAAAAHEPEFGALGPVIEFTGPTMEVLTYGGFRAPDGRTGHRERRPEPSPEHPDIAACDWIDGCAMLLRIAALDAVGLIDERFFMYYEDTELCLRMGRGGWKVGVVLEARIESQAGQHRRPGAIGYLFVRNSLELQRRAGTAALLREARRQARQLLTPVRDLISPRGRWTRPSALAALTGKLAGFVAFALRRFGPPPRWLPGLGDVSVKRGQAEGPGPEYPRPSAS